MKTLITNIPFKHEGEVYFPLRRAGDHQALGLTMDHGFEYAPKHYWKNAISIKGYPNNKYITAQYVNKSIGSSRNGPRRGK